MFFEGNRNMQQENIWIANYKTGEVEDNKWEDGGVL